MDDGGKFYSNSFPYQVDPRKFMIMLMKVHSMDLCQISTLEFQIPSGQNVDPNGANKKYYFNIGTKETVKPDLNE